ncbi:hypothetical protein LTR53_000805 [Teratosphaeriaceae sp. CCFEE 6253]|nr:hypothetical protein LTR53_000805 [Teratosphaeriaceae sp. CCFEE 6253]
MAADGVLRLVRQKRLDIFGECAYDHDTAFIDLNESVHMTTHDWFFRTSSRLTADSRVEFSRALQKIDRVDGAYTNLLSNDNRLSDTDFLGLELANKMPSAYADLWRLRHATTSQRSRRDSGYKDFDYRESDDKSSLSYDDDTEHSPQEIAADSNLKANTEIAAYAGNNRTRDALDTISTKPSAAASRHVGHGGDEKYQKLFVDDRASTQSISLESSVRDASRLVVSGENKVVGADAGPEGDSLRTLEHANQHERSTDQARSHKSVVWVMYCVVGVRSG